MILATGSAPTFDVFPVPFSVDGRNKKKKGLNKVPKCILPGPLRIPGVIKYAIKMTNSFHFISKKAFATDMLRG